MGLLSKKIICPYCLDVLTADDLEVRCPICRKGENVARKNALLKTEYRCTRPQCHNSLANDIYCKKCSRPLPSDIMTYHKYLRFSIIGFQGSGKTNFLTTMLYELDHARNFPLVISPLNNKTEVFYSENVKKIYRNRMPAAATPAGMPPQPLQWCVTDRVKQNLQGIHPACSLTIFDGAGEDMMHIDPTISRYISGSESLIILIDPLVFDEVQAIVPPEILRWSITNRHTAEASTHLIDELYTYLSNSTGMRAGMPIQKDVAFVFTKIDAVRDSFGSATVMQPSPHLSKGGFDRVDSDAVDAEIRDWLYRMGEHSFMNKLEAKFNMRRVRFFGVSSFGNPPMGEQRLGQVMPHRVLDPLMWMLAKEHIIPTIG